MQRMKNKLYIITGLLVSALLTCVLFPAVTAAADTGCPTCGMVWKDTCIPFERNNETAYNEELAASFVPVAANLTPVPDFGSRSWSDAFLSAHTLLKERYAFSQWKSVDWDRLYTTYAPKISDAEKKGDRAAYYRALRGYLFEIPDAHVNIMPTTGDFGAKYADIGGGYGFAVSRLDSGKVIVSYVANGSTAEKAGVLPGAEVWTWNGKEIADAIRATPHTWSATKPSTVEGILLQKTRFLTRAPVGTPVTITIRFGSEMRTVSLTAYDDGYDTLAKTTTFLGKQINDVGVGQSWTDIKPQISNDTVTYRTLPGGYTYIAIYGESYDVYQPFKSAMQSAIANKAPGIVIDLRYNGGGDDNIASCFAGWFVNKPVFYEYATKYDPGSGTFPIISEAWTHPRPNGYHGPVAVLVSPYTMSSGEGLPMVFANSGTGTIISWYGTNGAFGMNTVQAGMPLGQVLFFPDGASLNQNGTVQLDSNTSLKGGVAPQIRVPVNEDTVARSMAGEDVQMTYATKWLDEQATPGNAATSTQMQRASPGIVIVISTLGLLVIVAGRK